MSQLHTLSIGELRQQLLAKTITPQDIIHALEKQTAKHNPRIGGFLDCDYEDALQQAGQVDLSLPLGGIPIALKDNINRQGFACSCASKLLAEGYVSPYDANVVEKLKQAGAILLGRTNMDEFAMGSTTDNSALLQTNNPVDISRVAGGSSGGSAAVVAADMAIAALGSDTGGSIRQPASYCGIYGLKPTYGSVSRYGLVAFASSLDQIGPMTKTSYDAGLLYSIIQGHDTRDSTSLSQNLNADFLETITTTPDLKNLTIGLPTQFFIADSPAEQAVKKLANQLQEAGCTIKSIDLPTTEYVVATYYILASAEASSNLSRFDGVRYGNRKDINASTSPKTMQELYLQSRSQGFGDEVKRRIMLGTYVLSSGYYDAYYQRAQKVRSLIADDFNRCFQDVDIILTPTTPHVAPQHGASKDNPLAEYLSDIYTLGVSLAGLPALSMPVASEQIADAKLPLGAQIIAPHQQEQRILQLSHFIEQNFK